MIMSLSIFLIHEMRIIGAYQLDAIFTGQFYQNPVGFLLHGECFAVRPDMRILYLMALQLQIVVITEYPLVPLNGLTGSCDISIQDLGGHLTGYTGGANNQSFMELLQISTVGSRSHIEAIHPRPAHQLDQVLVTLVVLGEYDEVIASDVRLVSTARLISVLGYVHLTAEDGLERFLPFFLSFAVHLITIVEELLDTEHITMIGDGHATHAVAHRLVHKTSYARLSIKY